MKIHSYKTVLLAAVVLVTSMATANHASAINIGISVGAPPPGPGYVDRPWAPPDRRAVWIRPHNEWVNGRWVWVRGYYAYPPRRGARWVDGTYRHGQWNPGYWR